MANKDKVHKLLNETIVQSNMNNLEITSCDQLMRRTENQNRKLAKVYNEKSKTRFAVLLGTGLALIATGVVSIGGISIWSLVACGVMLGQTLTLLATHFQVKSIRKEMDQNRAMIRMYDRTKWFLESYGKHLENKRESLRALFEQKQLTDEQIGKKLAEILQIDTKTEELKNLFVDDYEGTKQAIAQAEQQDEQQQQM